MLVALLLIVIPAFLIALFVTAYLSRPDAVLRFVGMPNERSLHEKPTPHTGGIGVLSGLLVSVIIWSLWYPPSANFGWLCLGTFMVAAISLFDDIHPIAPLYRLVVHALAAGLVLSVGGLLPDTLNLPGINWGWPTFIAWLFGLGFIIWMVNLYNFMDGMDGFSGGMTVFGFAGYAVVGWLADATAFAALNLCIAAAAGGFLVWNFPPARIFMGDTGASTIGFLAAVIGLWAEREGIMPLWMAVLIFSPFIVDATFTLARRLLKKEKIWRAHKTHCYQRLVESGWGHRRTVLWEYVLMLATCCTAILAGFMSPWTQWGILLGWGIAYVGLIALVHWIEKFEAADRQMNPVR